jgi:protoheme IX farnesyltransferase
MLPKKALRCGVWLSVVGMLWLALGVNRLTSLLAALTLALYLFVYTPLKRRTALCTIVGAVPGAIPPTIGWAAAGHGLNGAAWVLFAILFLWQLPHFLAIAWLWRDDYARAGFAMLPVVEPDGVSTGRQSLLYAAALLPVSLLPSLWGVAGAVYFVGALLLGLAFLVVSSRMASSPSSASARRCFLASIAYLPLLLLLMVCDKTIW